MELVDKGIVHTSGQHHSARRVFGLWVLFTTIGYCATILVWALLPKDGAWAWLLNPVPIIVLSTSQWVLLRQYVPRLGVRGWLLSSIIGEILSYLVKSLLGFIFISSFLSFGFMELYGWSALTDGIAAAVIGLAQWFVLQLHFRGSYLWILASFAAGGLFSVLNGLFLFATFNVLSGDIAVYSFVEAIMEGIVFGGVMGLALISLLTKGIIADEPAGDAPSDLSLMNAVGPAE